MPTAARAIRLAFGFVGRYSGTTGALARSMRCDALRCIAMRALRALRALRCTFAACSNESTYLTGSPLGADRGQISIRLPGEVVANHGNQNPPPTPCGGTEPTQRCESLDGRYLVGCADRPHHVMWCPGCSMPDQTAVCRSLLLPHTHITQHKYGAQYRAHRTTDDSKVWPWERVAPCRPWRTARDRFLARRFFEGYSETLAGPSL